MSEALLGRGPENIDSDEHRVLTLVFLVLAGDKADARLRFYSYQALFKQKGLSNLDTIETLFNQDISQNEKTLKAEKGIIEELEALATTNSIASKELVKLYSLSNDLVNCYHYLELAYQQNSNDPDIAGLAKQMIQRLLDGRENEEMSRVLKSDNQAALMKLLKDQILILTISKLAKDLKACRDDELLILPKIPRQRREVYAPLLANSTLRIDEFCKLVDFYRYAVQMSQNVACDNCNAIKLYQEMSPAHQERFFEILKKCNDKRANWLRQDAKEYKQINLMKKIESYMDRKDSCKPLEFSKGQDKAVLLKPKPRARQKSFVLTADQKKYTAKLQVIWNSDPNSTNIERIKALLKDYTKDNSRFFRFFCGHWNRHHLQSANTIINIEGLSDRQLLKHLKRIKLMNEEGAMLAIIHFIEDKINEPVNDHISLHYQVK